MTKLNKPTGSAMDVKASRYLAAHTALKIAVIAAGLASVAAAAYTVAEWTFEVSWHSWVAMGLAALLAGSLAIVPPLLARPWGECSHGAVKMGLLIVAACFMFGDGYFQFNAIRVIYKLAGITDLDVSANLQGTVAVIFFQIASFFLAGLLAAATAEREEDLSLQRQREKESSAKAMAAQAALAEERGKREAKNAGDRERRARDREEAQRLGITAKEVVARRKAAKNQPKLSVV